MGYENRDYAREDRGGWSSSGGTGSFATWPVWKKIIAANVVVFLLQIFLSRPATFEEVYGVDRVDENVATEFREGRYGELPSVSIIQEWFKLDSEKVLNGQVWRLVTCGFCHDRQAIFHILFNMLFLFWFGSRLELKYGSSEFAMFYFAALLTSSLAYLSLDLYTNTLTPAIGASGAVWGVVALYALLYPYDTVRIYFLFPVPIWLMAVVYFLIDLHPVLLALSGENVYSGVGHAAHVGGAVFGYLYWRNDWRLMSIIERTTGRKTNWSNAQSNRSQKPMSIPMHGPYKNFESTDDEKMDLILQKISNEGREALTDDEEQFLLRTSAKMRNR